MLPQQKKNFLLASWWSMTKIIGSVSISQRHGSPDPDPHQNVMDPQHWLSMWSSNISSSPSVTSTLILIDPNANPHSTRKTDFRKTKKPTRFKEKKAGQFFLFKLNFNNKKAPILIVLWKLKRSGKRLGFCRENICKLGTRVVRKMYQLWVGLLFCPFALFFLPVFYLSKNFA